MNSAKEGLIIPEKPRTKSCCQSFFELFCKPKPQPSGPPSNIDSQEPPAQKKSTFKSDFSHTSTFMSNNRNNNDFTEKSDNFTNPETVTEVKKSKAFASLSHPIESYPNNRPLILETLDRKKQVLVKITEKRFDVIKNKKGLLNMHVPKDYEVKVPINPVLEFVASRLKNLYLLDLSNGIGEYSIYFQRHSDCVVSAFKSSKNAKKTMENMKKNDLNPFQAHMIEFPDCEIELKGRFDAVFMNPYTFFPNFCSKSMCEESTMQKMLRFRRKAPSLVFVLHRNTDNLDNFIELLYCLGSRQLKAGFEIMKVYYNEKLKFLYVFAGDLSSISFEEETDFLIKHFLEKCESRKKGIEIESGPKVQGMFHILNQTLGNSRILQMMQLAEEKASESCDVYETFRRILRKTRYFKKSGSLVFLNNNMRTLTKPSVFLGPNHNFLGAHRPSQSIQDESIDPSSFTERPFSLNEDFKLSEDELNEKKSSSSDEYKLSEYSINDTSNEDNEAMKKTLSTDPNNEDFEIIQANTFADTKLSLKVRKLSLEEKDESKKEVFLKKTFEEG